MWRVTLGDIYRHFVTYGFTPPERLFPKNAPDDQHGAHGAEGSEEADASKNAKNEKKNGESLYTHGALGAHGDMVHASPDVDGPLNVLICPHLAFETTSFPDGSVIRHCTMCKKIVDVTSWQGEAQ